MLINDMELTTPFQCNEKHIPDYPIPTGKISKLWSHLVQISCLIGQIFIIHQFKAITTQFRQPSSLFNLVLLIKGSITRYMYKDSVFINLHVQRWRFNITYDVIYTILVNLLSSNS